MMSERLPLHVLPTFVIAARLENLRATAQQVHLTHGAVSQQIQLLEQAVGYPLFERRGRGVRLNAAGKEMLAAVEPALQALQQGVARARRAAASQTLRISVLPSFAHYWLLPRLPAFHEACADIALDIDASLTLQDLSLRGFDAAIRIGNGQWAGLQAQRIASGDVLPVASPDMALQWGTAFENGGDVPLLEHDVSPWRAWFNTQGRSLCGRQQALFNDAGLLIRAAEQGFGIALAKTLLVQDAIAAGRLVALAAPCRLSDDDVYLVWPQTAGLTPAVLRLLQWLQQQLAAI
ncbi:LysR substrate-binding domain-containing protein [Serratia marcescens]|uniref:LysR substrate-binding domain-containing protein n=2 Tax=Serratia marcescens TaxID=615 RepID=UPI001F150DDB|nr:LysR substrate-binding domain-containing protein [Serratia marcescens]MDP8610895.1 LysR substrate-binding domain-containing protein [Serratia marcescens]MDP8616029.1 LysR substrate-binding domain-containing protein [Serratia marcescens]MDP8646156.1 LysR substrate-binding domain-containing protein [Serratia marcescens]MDP8656048.1 LysR substrate-binding domain-containing protein [Serratia marcescens]MDP8661032.1 LysR substrate-binding domain-containing protein [Serratia marcescens]